MSKFKYRGRSAETVSARAKQTGGSYDSYLNSSLSFLKVKEGSNELRILPPTWDIDGPWGDNWGIEVYVHRDIGPDNGVYLCLDKMREKYGNTTVPTKLGKCPLCAARHELPEDDADALKALKPGKQILCYVINRDAEKEGPLVWRLGWQLERDIQIRSQDKKTGAVIEIDHPDHGFDVSFTREGAGLKTKYVGVDIARDESPLSEKEVRQQKWLDFITDNPLTDALVFYDADYLEQVYMGKKGRKGGNAEDAEEDDRPTRTRRPAAPVDEDEEEAPAPRRRARVVEEEEEDESAPRRKRPSAEPDEEEEAPRRRRVVEEEDDELPDDAQMRRNAKKTRVVADEEEEDEPAPRRRARAEPPDDEEEPAPVRRARRVDPDEVDEDEEEAPPRRRAATAKRGEVQDDEEDEADAPKGRTVAKARASLDRLKRR